MFHARIALFSLLLLPASASAFQGPPYDGGGHGQGSSGGGGGGSQGGSHGKYGGPGDTIPADKAAGREGTPGASQPSSSPHANPAPVASTPSSQPGMPTPVALTTESDDGWWLWWEYNKMEFLRPNRLGLWGFPATGADAESELKARSGVARHTLEPVLVAALSDPDATIRSAAAIALARIVGGDAVEPLLHLLGDPSLEVRERAVLALGASGSARAVLPLLAIARDGTPVQGSNERVSPYASSLGIVALALGRRAGFDPRIDAEVAAIVRAHTGPDREAVGAAALIYQCLAPCPEISKLALEMVDDTKLSPAARCRAVESLSHSSDSGAPARLIKLLSGPRLDLRRSAALALGSSRDSEALAALEAAFALESEALTRGFILISIGRQGGEKARDFLVHVAKDEESGMRKWSALALGILARSGKDAEAARAIRETALREKSRESVAAYWIAAGLARDEGSRSAIADGLLHGADPRQRMYAATSLALLGGEASEATLRSRIEADDSALVRASIASALGYLGRREDAPALANAIQRLREPGLQGFTATALSFHGSVEAFLTLSEMCRSTTGPTVRRAAAIEGLGMMLGDSQPLLFAEVSKQANYTVFPEWMKGLFQVTL
ncbi:MAG TPA: HEAT repeat domain-containing protein [Planctomycetota bacterium]|jgi:HEAT repeat protein|nr:HEAT repeat domain-containing protein [Planctomycetota bacterium]